MARAFLHLNKEIVDSFVASQNTSITTTRIIKIGITGEALSLLEIVPASGSASDDFSTLLTNHLSDQEASLVLFHMPDAVTDTSRAWLLLAWVPDACRVRDKMLYAR
jgi:hypothetical protein